MFTDTFKNIVSNFHSILIVRLRVYISELKKYKFIEYRSFGRRVAPTPQKISAAPNLSPCSALQKNIQKIYAK